MRDYTETLSGMVATLALPCTEEPMRARPEGDYITFRNLGRGILYASGEAYAEYAFMAVTVYCVMGPGWQETVDGVLAALKANGVSNARIAGESWNDEIKRRVVVLYVYVRGGWQ